MLASFRFGEGVGFAGQRGQGGGDLGDSGAHVRRRGAARVARADRADDIRNRRVRPEEDNMLKVCTDGRKAALDLRMLGQPMDVPGKIGAAATRIAGIYHARKDDAYPGPDGRDAPARGSFQPAFSDIGTPGDDWNVYEELRDQLTALGVPRDMVRFIHEAKSDRDKGELFATCRAGAVAVLIGSTEKMGVGTNVQFRAVALHHLDCPWRPADVAQREGRLLRQGNHNIAVLLTWRLRGQPRKTDNHYLQ
jgi:hypothetical protein